MSAPRPSVLDRLPVLTEVLEGAPAAQGDPRPASDRLTAEVLRALQPRLDALLETRLRAALAPALARAADALVLQAAPLLAAELRALVEAEVAQALARRDGP